MLHDARRIVLHDAWRSVARFPCMIILTLCASRILARAELLFHGDDYADHLSPCIVAGALGERFHCVAADGA